MTFPSFAPERDSGVTQGFYEQSCMRFDEFYRSITIIFLKIISEWDLEPQNPLPATPFVVLCLLRSTQTTRNISCVWRQLQSTRLELTGDVFYMLESKTTMVHITSATASNVCHRYSSDFVVEFASIGTVDASISRGGNILLPCIRQ